MPGLERLAERDRKIADDEFRVVERQAGAAGRFQFRRAAQADQLREALPPLGFV